MTKFKDLVVEVKNDRSTEFLIDHGINPSIRNQRIPLYDPQTNGLVILVGPVKSSRYFDENNVDGKTYPDDRVIIKSFSEERVFDPDSGYNFYPRDYSDSYEITVDEFMDIYNHPRNDETREDIENGLSLDTEEQRKAVKDKFIQHQADLQKKQDDEFNTWLSRNGSYFDITDKSVLEKLYDLNKKGVDILDLQKSPVIWEWENRKTLDIVKAFILNKKRGKPAETQKELDAAFRQKRMEWFKNKISGVKLLKDANEWLKQFKESAVVESAALTDPKQVKDMMMEIGIDPKFYDVPITIEPYFDKNKYQSSEEDPDAEPVQKVTVKGFPDAEKTKDKDLVRVYDTVSDRTFNMNISDLKDAINDPVNDGAELNTVDFRLQAKNQNKSLNKGIGHFVSIPEPVVEEMLKTVQDLDEFKYSEFGFVDNLLKYYKTNPNSELIKFALNLYNTEDNKTNYIIRGKDGYMGWVPYVNYKVKPAIGSKDEFKKAMK